MDPRENSSTTARRNSLIHFFLHGALLAIAAACWIRFSTINAPFVYHDDEPRVVARAVRMAVTGDLNPHWFVYPTLMMYIHAAVFKVFGFLSGFPIASGMPVPYVQGANPEAFPLYFTARLVIICFALGTLLMILRLASRIASPWMAYMAGLTFAGSQVARHSATHATVDMPMTFFVLASVILLIKFVDSAGQGRPNERCLWGAVVLGGLAAGAKYTGAAVLVGVPVAMLLAGRSLRWSVWRLCAAAMLSIVVFILSTPFSVLDPATFFDMRIGMLQPFSIYSSSGVPGHEGGISLFKAAADLFLRHSPLVVLALFSPLAARTTSIRKPLLLVAVVPVAFLGMVGVAQAYYARNLMPSLPPLAILTAAGAWALMGRTFSHGTAGRSLLRAGVPLVVAYAVAAYGLLSLIVDNLRQAKQIDTRTAAYTWITQTMPRGATIMTEGFCPQLYFSGRFRVGYLWTISEIPFEKLVREFDYVVVGEIQRRKYENLMQKTYEPVSRLPLVREWVSAPGGTTRGPAIRMYATATARSELRNDSSPTDDQNLTEQHAPRPPGAAPKEDE